MKLLSTTQAAQLLGHSRQWIWVLIRIGKLKARKIGKTYIIKETDLNKYQTHLNKEIKNEPVL